MMFQKCENGYYIHFSLAKMFNHRVSIATHMHTSIDYLTISCQKTNGERALYIKIFLTILYGTIF